MISSCWHQFQPTLQYRPENQGFELEAVEGTGSFEDAGF